MPAPDFSLFSACARMTRRSLPVGRKVALRGAFACLLWAFDLKFNHN
jgi:hypothetical protein